jgi:hypothetical protein
MALTLRPFTKTLLPPASPYTILQFLEERRHRAFFAAAVNQRCGPATTQGVLAPTRLARTDAFH